MGNKWITLFLMKKITQCLALKHLYQPQLLQKMARRSRRSRRFSLLLIHGVLFQLVYEERGGVVFRHRHMMAIVLRFKKPQRVDNYPWLYHPFHLIVMITINWELALKPTRTINSMLFPICPNWLKGKIRRNLYVFEGNFAMVFCRFSPNKINAFSSLESSMLKCVSPVSFHIIP